MSAVATRTFEVRWEDWYATANHLLGREMPEECVDRIPGLVCKAVFVRVTSGMRPREGATLRAEYE